MNAESYGEHLIVTDSIGDELVRIEKTKMYYMPDMVTTTTDRVACLLEWNKQDKENYEYLFGDENGQNINDRELKKQISLNVNEACMRIAASAMYI